MTAEFKFNKIYWKRKCRSVLKFGLIYTLQVVCFSIDRRQSTEPGWTHKRQGSCMWINSASFLLSTAGHWQRHAVRIDLFSVPFYSISASNFFVELLQTFCLGYGRDKFMNGPIFEIEEDGDGKNQIAEWRRSKLSMNIRDVLLRMLVKESKV